MTEKIHRLTYWSTCLQLYLLSLWDWLWELTLYEKVLMMTLVLSPLAFFFSIFFQWRQTRAIEKAALSGKVIKSPRLFK